MFYVLSPALEEQQNSDCPGEGLERAWTSDYELGWGGGTDWRCERGQIIIKGSLTAQGFSYNFRVPDPVWVFRQLSTKNPYRNTVRPGKLFPDSKRQNN